jgi:hypothetical protein
MEVDAQCGVYCDGGVLQNGTHLDDLTGVPAKTKHSTWLLLSALVDQRRATSVCRRACPVLSYPAQASP